MTLAKWVPAPAEREKPIKKATMDDLRILTDSFYRWRRLEVVLDKYSNVDVDLICRAPLSDDEWVYVVAVRPHVKEAVDDYVDFEVCVYPLRTIDKATAVRRAYGWGVRTKDGPVDVSEIECLAEDEPPVPDEPHVPDVAEAAYFHYHSF